jgi:molybdopterin converting factor small subunit
MSKITVRYFAVLRERRGTDREIIEVDPGTTIAALYSRLFPGVGPVGFVRNRAMVDGATPIADGDEIGFLPPFGGG